MSSSLSIPPLPVSVGPQAAPARSSTALIALIWGCVALSLLLAASAWLGFAPMRHWGDSWALEFHFNKTQAVVNGVGIIALVAAGCFVIAALLAMGKPGVRSTMWLRHMLIAGYLLVGAYLFLGVRMMDLIWEKGLRLEIEPPALNSQPNQANKPAPAATPAATVAPVSPTTQKAATRPAITAPATSAAPANRTGGPTMKTDGIDLDAPPPKPAPSDTPSPAPPSVPELHAVPSSPAPATTPSTHPTTGPASTAPANASSAGLDSPPPDEPVQFPEIIANQYRLYWRPMWNRVGVGAVLALAVLLVLTHVLAAQRARDVAAPGALGSTLNDGRGDVGYHANLDNSIAIHVILIMILPLLLQLHWPKDPLDFSTPGGGGGGEQQQEEVKVIKRKKKPPKKVRKYMSSKNSAIAFFIPKMEDSKVLDTVEKETENQFKVETGTTGHGHGHGKGRGKGNGHGSGWGNGNGKVRFYHLHYSGVNTNWDDGFTDHKDSNLLHEWEQRERKEGSDLPFGDAIALNVSDLRRDVHGLLPPFVFVTGNVGAMSDHETKIIKKYIDDGGMIFADPQLALEGSFINWVHQKLYPGEHLIPLDNRQDPIFDGRYYFAGPPAFWSGNKSFLGLKHGDRWVIICDRGRMADGWKPPINEDCIRMGINIIDYAHDHYANAPGH